MKAIKYLLILMFYFSNLSVSFANKHFTILAKEKNLIQFPKNCIFEKLSCSIKTNVGYRYKIQRETDQITLGSNSVIIRQKKNEFSFLNGEIWSENKTPIYINTEFGTLTSEKGEFLLEKTSEYVLARSVNGELKVKPLGYVDEVILYPGYELKLKAVEKNQKSKISFITPILLSEFLYSLGRLYDGTKESFKEKIIELHPFWVTAVKTVSELNYDYTQRKIAEFKLEQEKLEFEKNKSKREREFLRKLYKNKVTNEDLIDEM